MVHLGAPLWGVVLANAACTDCAQTVTCSGALQNYNGFNLVVGDVGSVSAVHVSNRGTEHVEALQPGVHGVSNGEMQSRWPKVCAAAAVWDAMGSRACSSKAISCRGSFVSCMQLTNACN